MPIDAIHLDPANVRQHPARNLEAIKASLQRYGQRKPLVVDRETGTIEAGNATWEAAKALGWPQLAVVFVQDDPVTATGYAIADNRTAELALWDDAGLVKTLQDLKAEGEMMHVGFDEAELDALLRLISPPTPETFNVGQAIAAAPELSEQVRPGQVWGLGRHRIMCGDSTEDLPLLLAGKPAHMVFTDPPYNVDYGADNQSHPSWGKKWAKGAIANDALDEESWRLFLTEWMRAMMAVLSGACYICMSAKEYPGVREAFASAGGHWSSDIVWVKDRFVLGRKDFHSRYEALLYGWPEGRGHYWSGGRDQDDVWEIQRHSQNELHPTQKPVELVLRAVDLSSPAGGLVVDPFLGSGTTLIAADQIGRTCYGMEIDPKWCAVAIARWESYTGESAVLVEEPDGASRRAPDQVHS